MKKFIVAIAVFAMLAGSAAYAADWNFYGSARVSTWYKDKDIADTTNLEMGLQGNSRIGANVKVSDELTGRFEYGSGVNLRLLYGEWDFGAGKLLIGQDYEPVWQAISNQAYDGDYGLGGYGENYAGRTPQIKLTFGTFNLAFLEPNVTYYDSTEADADALKDGAEVKLPMIQAKYRYIADTWNAGISGGWATFDVNDDEDVTSYMLAATARATFGAFGLRGQVWFGENVGNIAGQETSELNSGIGYAQFDGTDVVDVEAMGFAVVADYAFNDMFGIEVGYGYVELDTDDNVTEDDEVASFYLSAPITLAPGVFIVPEIGVVDYEEAGQEEITYYGAKWQINF